MSNQSATATAAILGILLLCGQMVHSQQAENSQRQQGPSLAETISFMDKSVKPEMGSVSSANTCEIYVARNRRYTFALPKGKTLKGRDQFGVPRYGFDWMVVTEPEVTRFDFAAIDPSSINSKPVPSAAFLKEHNVDENPSELKQTDLTAVFFNTANSTNSIETGHFNMSSDGASSTVAFDDHGGMGIVVFESKDRAERFVTAFIHAVALCGGKDSDFPPTPSKP
jgi:hypothetical protein